MDKSRHGRLVERRGWLEATGEIQLNGDGRMYGAVCKVEGERKAGPDCYNLQFVPEQVRVDEAELHYRRKPRSGLLDMDMRVGRRGTRLKRRAAQLMKSKQPRLVVVLASWSKKEKKKKKKKKKTMMNTKLAGCCSSSERPLWHHHKAPDSMLM